MPQRRLLIDLENVPTSDYTLLPDDFQIMVFIGKTQISGLLAMIDMAKIWGKRLEVCQVSDTGNNALDMHLAFHLGRLACENPKDKFVILAKDKDYDPLVKHLISLEIQCRRIDSLADLLPTQHMVKTTEQKIIDSSLNPANAPALVCSHYEKVCLHLKKMTLKDNTRKSLPSNRVSLKSHLVAMFKTEISPSVYESIIVRLFRENKVVEEKGKLIYCFPVEEKP